jgi:hypothetical protein
VRDRAFQTPESRAQFLALAHQFIAHSGEALSLTIGSSDR